jgi:hypothetical protein
MWMERVPCKGVSERAITLTLVEQGFSGRNRVTMSKGMRPSFLILVAVLAIGGYSALRIHFRSVYEACERPVVRPLPFKVQVTQTPEEKEKQEIQDQAKSLFSAKDFDKLDALARKYRESKEHYADGLWKMNEVYAGILPDKQASDSDWSEHLAVLESWMKAKPDSITARVALGDSLVSYAWKARGGGYAKTVTKDGWKLFGERLKQATDVLIEAHTLKEQCPRWWSVMLQAALGSGADRASYDRIFNEAVAFDPSYMVYYSRKANYLLPRWHGRPGEWEAFVARAADNIGGEDGDILYARVVWFEESSFRNVFRENKVSWERTDKGLEALMKRYPTSLAVKSERAYLAGMAGDRPKARKYFDALGGKVDLSVWDSRNNFVEHAQIVYAE